MTWDWNKAIPAWEFNSMALANFPRWDKPDGSICCVVVECIAGANDSRQIAVEWDDLSNGKFYYRDKTQSGTPLVNNGEKYLSLFYFQFVDDAVLFAEMYHGKCNWGDSGNALLQM